MNDVVYVVLFKLFCLKEINKTLNIKKVYFLIDDFMTL